MRGKKAKRQRRDGTILPADLRHQMKDEIAGLAAVRAGKIGEGRKACRAAVRDARAAEDVVRAEAWGDFEAKREKVVVRFRRLAAKRRADAAAAQTKDPVPA